MKNGNTDNSIEVKNDDHAERKVVIAFDTSNYTSSAAVLDTRGNILADCRKLLTVKAGKRGLRQSDALFQHVVNLPELLETAIKEATEAAGRLRIVAAAASNRPRPTENSYMPVFLAGEGLARTLAVSHGVPLKLFSHQEGHIAAARIDDAALAEKDASGLAFHLSGGTGEILLTKGNLPIDIVGGTKDISFGQLLDRVGVALGLRFPAGAEMDAIAEAYRNEFKYHYSRSGNIIPENPILPQIKIDGSFVNLSGIETAAQHLIDKSVHKEMLITELFFRIAAAVEAMIRNAFEHTDTDNVTLAGGVAASKFLQNYLSEHMDAPCIKMHFSNPKYSVDNAVGTAFLAIGE